MILLFSGGVDSYIAWHWLKKPKTIYFNLHTKYSEKEMVTVKKLIPGTIIEDCLNMSDREEAVTAFVPYRNLHLALLANKYDDSIIIVGLKDDKVNDKNERAFHQFSNLMTELSGKAISVKSPFWEMTKERIVRWYVKEYQGDISKLQQTLSCYSDTPDNFCGTCPACFRKWCAFRANKITVPDFTNVELMKTYYRRAKMGAFYIPERNETAIKVLDEYSKQKGIVLWEEEI